MILNKRMSILVSGCSYTENAKWVDELFTNVINYGKSGAGNTYISNSIIYNIDLLNPPSYVFILFSGVNRIDLSVPKTLDTQKLAIELKYYGIVNDILYLFTGSDKINIQICRNYRNIKSLAWPEIYCIDDFLKLPKKIKDECIEKQIFYFGLENSDLMSMINTSMMLNYLNDTNYLQTLTYQNILNCQTFLERHLIPYNFSFISNVFDTNNKTQFGVLNKSHPLYKRINWSNYINDTPYEFAVKYNCLADDQFHLSHHGQRLWAQKIRNKIPKKILTR